MSIYIQLFYLHYDENEFQEYAYTYYATEISLSPRVKVNVDR